MINDLDAGVGRFGKSYYKHIYFYCLLDCGECWEIYGLFFKSLATWSVHFINSLPFGKDVLEGSNVLFCVV
jgi:hypothetical protein